MRSDATTRAAVYLRVSTVEQSSEPVQADHCQRAADQLGWTVVATYVDHGESAFAEKRDRVQWEAMLADADAGEFTAILAYDDDRLWRDYAEQSAVFVALGQAGVTHVHTTRTYRTDSDDDRGLSALAAVFGWMQSAKTRRKVRDRLEDNVRRGHPGGGTRPFGYRRVPADKRRGVPAELVVDEVEAAAIRDACARILGGEPLRSIVRDWRERVPTVTGGRWTNTNVKRSITAPRVAGLRAWNGDIVGEAAWEAIVDRDTWERVRGVLNAPGRGPAGPAPRKHVLRGLVVCGLCDTKLATRRVSGRDVSNYVCPTASDGGCGRIGVRCDYADGEVRDRLVARLAGEGFAAAMRAAAGDADAADAAAELWVARARLDTLGVEYAAERLVTKAAYLESKRRLEARIGDAERRLARSQTAAALAGLPATTGGLLAWWDAADIAERHDVLRGLVGRVVVSPSQSPGRFDPNRVTVEWTA